jgi:hypothetical protein
MANPKTGLFTRFALAFTLLAPGLLAGEVVPDSRQFEIQPPVVVRPLSGSYNHVAATATSLGPQGFVVGWETTYAYHSRYYGNDVTTGRRLLVDGSAAETFNPTTFMDDWGWAGWLSFANLGEGRFVSVACTSSDINDDVWFRRFAAGQPPLDPESVLLYDDYSSTRSDLGPRIASNGNGLFVIAWERSHYDSPYKGMGYPNETLQEMAQVFDADGRSVSPEIAVTQPVPVKDWPDPLSLPLVGMDANGSFVVLWTELGLPLHQTWGQRFDRTGSPQGDRFRIGSTGAAAIVMAPSGEFTVAWRAPVKPGVMLLSRFTATGRQTGPVARLAYQSYDGVDPAMALDRSGRVALFWIDEQSRPTLAVFGASLNPLGPVVFAAPSSFSAPWASTGVGVAFGDDGRILTVWVGRRGTRNRDSILGRFWKVR